MGRCVVVWLEGHTCCAAMVQVSGTYLTGFSGDVEEERD